MSENAIARLHRRIMMAIGRGRLTAVNDAGAVQVVQIKLGSDEVRDDMPRLAEYGFTSSPPIGSDAVAIFITGDRSNGVVIGTGNQAARFKGLAPGEVAIHDDLGQVMRLTRTGIVITAPLGLTIIGDIVTTGTIINNGHHVDSTHEHGGVQTGGGNTGVPV